MIKIQEEKEFNTKDEHVYYFYGSLSGTKYFTQEDYEVSLTDREILSYETEIEEAINEYNKDDPDLAEYCYVDGGDMKINSITIGVKYIDGMLCSCAKIVSLESIEDDEELVERLRDWLTGQYSDGWGEGFEQHPIDTYTDEYEHEEYHEDEDGNYGYETETDYQRVDVCIHFWQPDMEPLRFEIG